MKKIISDIHNAIQNSRKTIEFLKQNSSWEWFEEYPIAIINEITRIKDEKSLNILEDINFFNDQGFSKNSYAREEITQLQASLPSALKTAYCLCLKNKHKGDFAFHPKFEHDKWKKVQDEGNFAALVELSKFDETRSSKAIESELRDILRSRKEIPSLKATGFVWIVTVPKATEITNILNHYFLDMHIYVQKGKKTTYIAWSEKLANINMRYFVNTP